MKYSKSRYELLTRFLKSRDISRVRLGFAQIEKILGFKLPAGAYQYEAWWNNNAAGHSHARAWVAAGWRTEEIDLAAKKVTFARAEATRPSQRKSDPWGCMAGTATIFPGTDLTAPSGAQWNAEKGLLRSE